VIQLDGSVVQHEACTNNLARFVWCNSELVVQAVPSSLGNTNTSFNGGSGDAVCIIVCLFFG